MKKQLEARIVITRGRRLDLMAEIDVWDPQSGKLLGMPTPAGPSERAIEVEVYKIKAGLERAGHRVSVKDSARPIIVS